MCIVISTTTSRPVEIVDILSIKSKTTVIETTTQRGVSRCDTFPNPARITSASITAANAEPPTTHHLSIPTPSIKIYGQTLVRTRYIIRPAPPNNIRPPLPHLLILPRNRRQIRAPIPISHRRIQRPRPVRLIPHRRLGRPTHNIILKAIEAATAVRTRHRRRAIASLLQTDIAVRRAIVVGRDLEFRPGGGEEGPALDAALEGFGEGDEEGVGAGDGDDGVGIVEVGARGAVAVPVVVVEGVRLGDGAVVAEDDAGPADLGGGDVVLHGFDGLQLHGGCGLGG